MTLNEHLRLYQETLIADIGIAIHHGELNNFEPLKKLERYLGDEGLDKLRFSDLKNEIHIEKKNIYESPLFLVTAEIAKEISRITRLGLAFSFSANVFSRSFNAFSRASSSAFR